MFDKKEFAANLRAARGRVDITLEELSSRTGISVNSLASYESGNGYTPGADKIASMCQALQIDPNWLFNWQDAV